MAIRILDAARNSAAWCDLVCHTHGVSTVAGERFWVARHRAPHLYPDAVTVAESVAPEEFLPAIDNTTGASIKDSYASLNLTPFGYEVQFDADWIAHDGGACEPAAAPEPVATGAEPPPGPELPPGWSVVEDSHALARWSAVSGLGHLIRSELLSHPDVRILAGHDQHGINAGAILSRGAGAVGVTNLFAAGPDPQIVWSAVVTAATSCFPGLPLCGYEQGRDLAPALGAGFAPIGRLQVWVKSDHGART